MNERLTYVLRFHRPAAAEGAPEPPTTGPGLSVTTTIADGTIGSRLEALDGDEATLALQYQVGATGTQFVESGTLTFGDAQASSLTFAWLNAGTLLAADPDGFSHGAIAYGISAGTGALAGASGIITSNFLVDLQTNELWDTHLGIILLPS